MDSIIDFARRGRYIRESTPNHGLRVEGIQRWAGGAPGDSWCMEMVWWWLDYYTSGRCPFPREQSVEEFHQLAIANGWIVEIEDVHIDEPNVVWLAISINADGKGHHIALVTAAVPLLAVAGNTSEDGKSSNGTGCFEHEISPEGKKFVRVPLPAALPPH